MPTLKKISETVRQVAEAISLAVGIDTEIVDNELTIIAGTSLIKNKIGEKEEAGLIDGNYLYARVLREARTVFVKEAYKDITYDQSVKEGTTKELAEICTPIVKNGKVLGIIGLIAFKKNQQTKLIDNELNMILFIEKMADLLASKASEYASYEKVINTKNEIMTVLETIHEGMLSIDRKGYITHFNSIAQVLLKKTNNNLIGLHLSTLMPNSPALKILESGQGYTEREEIFKNNGSKFHFIVTTKPIISNNRIIGAVLSFRDIIEAQKLVYNMQQRNIKYTFDDIIGSSISINESKEQALRVARGSSTVLITGESGTGKELFAKSIHYASNRQNGPFISVNCAAIPETLLESELVGYEEGAFTGAKQKGKAGKFELANGGTILLDEIGEMPLHLQVKLLHVLQNRRFERVGGNKTINVDVRVIAATNRNLEDMMRSKKFREDLYYRLSVIPLKIPPLRKRVNDIPILMNYFLKKYNTFMNKKIMGFTKEVVDLFCSYDWPGNVRELENAVEYGVNMAYTDKIILEAVPVRIIQRCTLKKPFNSTLSLEDHVKSLEREILTTKLEEHGINHKSKLKIANELNISRATLYRKLSEYNLA